MTVRFWLRDLADGDLAPELAAKAESHAHDCRSCSLALARAEFETLRLRRALSGAAREAAPRAGFAGRALLRLLREAPEAVVESAAQDAGGAVVDSGAKASRADRMMKRVVARAAAELAAGRPASRRPFGLRAMAIVALAWLPVLCLVVASVLSHDGLDPTAEVRVSILRAEGSVEMVGSPGQLQGGAGLGEGSILQITGDAAADVEWYDASVVGEQPAALLSLRGDAQLRVEEQLELLYGSMDVHSQRPMEVVFGDGSYARLGAGFYRLSVEPEEGPGQDLGQETSALAVRVEVQRGDKARVATQSGRSVAVGVGQVYSVARGVAGVLALNGAAFADPALADSAAPRVLTQAPTPDLTGSVLDQGGSPLALASVRLSFPSSQGMTVRMCETDGSGRFELPHGSGLSGTFVVVEVAPPAARPDLAAYWQTAAALLPGTDAATHELAPIRLGAGRTVEGLVLDAVGSPAVGVRVVPVFFDETLGLVQAWLAGVVETDASGAFALRQVPAVRPSGLALCALAIGPQGATTFDSLPNDIANGPAVLRLRSLQPVRLSGLEPSAPAVLLEEVQGMPSGTAVRRLMVMADSEGVVESAMLSQGRLWLERIQDSRRFVMPLARATASTAVAGGELLARDAAILAGHIVDGPNGVRLEVAVQSRFEGASLEVADGEMLRVRARSLAPSDLAQAYAIGFNAEGFGISVRFLGLVADGQALRVQLQPSDLEIVAISDTGMHGRASVTDLRVGGALQPLELSAYGSARLDPAVQPTQSSLRTTWMPLTLGPTGGRPPLFRLLHAGSDWTAADLLPGQYQVNDALGRSFVVTIEAGRQAALR